MKFALGFCPRGGGNDHVEERRAKPFDGGVTIDDATAFDPWRGKPRRSRWVKSAEIVTRDELMACDSDVIVAMQSNGRGGWLHHRSLSDQQALA